MNQVGLAIIIPKWARIFPASHFFDRHRLAPGTRWRIRGTHENALLWRGKINPVTASVITKGGRPASPSVAIAIYEVIRRIEIKFLENMPDDLPIHQIIRFQNRNSWHIMKT